MGDATEYLTAQEVSARWKGKVTVATLAQWRSRKYGPTFRKLGGRVVYTVADIEAFEDAAKHVAAS